MNKEWHNQNLFPETATEEEKDAWRERHQANCNCGKMLLPYRKISREEDK